MYFLSKFCCICMNKRDLKHVFDVDNDGISHFNKLTSSIFEMNFKEMNNQRLICGECCTTLNTVYNFRQACLRSKTNLITYISQLQTYGHVSGTLSVRLKDIKHEVVVVKQEIEIKCENEGSYNNVDGYNPSNDFPSANFHSVYISAPIKEECDIGDDTSFAYGDATIDRLKGVHSEVKVEDVGYQTKMEVEDYTGFGEIDPLSKVKEEPVSDTEKPQDGSIGQSGAKTSGDPKDSTQAADRRHKCEMCEKSFIRKSHLTRHKRIHSSEVPYKCDICKKNFMHMYNLMAHIRLHAGEEKYECKICKNKFTYKHNLTKHMLMHSCDKQYKCEICKKSFIYNSILTKHMQIHSVERPYECKICKEKFIHNYKLTHHMLCHSDERPYKCKICKKSFSLNSNLTKHIHIHSVERPYECEICHKNFKRKSTLTVHMNIHSDEKKYECKICKKDFNQKNNLSRHMLKHSEESQ